MSRGVLRRKYLFVGRSTGEIQHPAVTYTLSLTVLSYSTQVAMTTELIEPDVPISRHPYPWKRYFQPFVNADLNAAVLSC